MLSKELKEATKVNHQLLEKQLIGIIRSIHSKQDYAKLLVCFFGFIAGLEIDITAHLDVSVLPDYANRRKSAAIANDLQLLGVALPPMPDTIALPQFNDHYQALGALYVLEGSTLGGKIICKMILQQLNLADMSELTFFYGYGGETDSMWQRFKDTLDNAQNENEKDTIIQSANDTFVLLKQWFTASGF
jgi:heme oxygenase